MRVSKVVREYIEKQVASKMPKTENELQFDKLEKTINKANHEYHELMKQAKEQVVAKLMQEHNLSNNMVDDRSSYSYSPFSTWGTEERQKADIDHQNRRVAINQKIEDIIVNLELGGTKADLEKMLSEI